MKYFSCKQLTIIQIIALITISCSSNQLPHQINGEIGGLNIDNFSSSVINNLLVGQAIIQNKNSKVVNAYYRCQFFDANRMQLGDDDLWQLITIYPYQSQVIKCNSIDSSAITFKIDFSTKVTNIGIQK